MSTSQKLIQSHRFYSWSDRLEDAIVHRCLVSNKRRTTVIRLCPTLQENIQITPAVGVGDAVTSDPGGVEPWQNTARRP
jgi:hypothetical protein